MASRLCAEHRPWKHARLLQRTSPGNRTKPDGASATRAAQAAKLRSDSGRRTTGWSPSSSTSSCTRAWDGGSPQISTTRPRTGSSRPQGTIPQVRSNARAVRSRPGSLARAHVTLSKTPSARSLSNCRWLPWARAFRSSIRSQGQGRWGSGHGTAIGHATGTRPERAESPSRTVRSGT